ncbi:MAG TPA: class I SAM-dependent methyltransferase [Usitatibacteraceae bacterium]|nr:class I SAM-dependent methyltransferase [Usitatibacteraceae bacterium]HQY46016.1 class I SAM-dependent methyltransferase [Usitatibacteraceae bacterium]HRA22023.1 class I SAM-dependent methyltransferase [Usitatibacteraceae bacterium]
MGDYPVIDWAEEGAGERSARWRSESGAPPPRQMAIVDDRITADQAYGLACQGTALLWRGDYQNARQLLAALGKRSDRGPRKAKAATPAEAFNRHRQLQAQRARTLGMLLVELDGEHAIALRRAPDVREACREAWGEGEGPCVVSLRELLGVIGAHEWRAKGIPVAALGARIHPHYGVFTPIRQEYVDLVAKAPLPAAAAGGIAFDVGTGTGVLAAVLARRGIARVIATDRDPRALACARENLVRLGLAEQAEVVEADLFPEGRAALVLCNPPWVPARPATPIEGGIYDPESRMLRAFLAGLAAHLAPGGEGWLVLSDLAEHLGLRTRQELLALFEGAGLAVLGRREAKPRHPKAADEDDPLHAARAAEVTSLWRLGK